jgi:site-specific recombinase XerD
VVKATTTRGELEAYLVHLRACGRTPATLRAAAEYLGYLQCYLGARPLRTATRADLEGFAQTQAHLAPATQTVRLAYLASYYRWLEQTGQMLVSPADVLVRPRLHPELDPRKVLREDEVAKLLAAPTERTATGQRDRALLELLYGTGIRRQELVGLDVSDWLVGERLVMVRHGKWRKERLVPLGARAAEVLGAYLRWGRRTLVGEQPTPALLISRTGRRLRADYINRLVALHSRRALGRRVSPHMLRHSYATHLLRGGADVRAVQMLLGHRRINSTVRYTHLQIDDLKQMVARFHPREQSAVIPPVSENPPQ